MQGDIYVYDNSYSPYAKVTCDAQGAGAEASISVSGVFTWNCHLGRFINQASGLMFECAEVPCDPGYGQGSTWYIIDIASKVKLFSACDYGYYYSGDPSQTQAQCGTGVVSQNVLHNEWTGVAPGCKCSNGL